MTNFVKWLYRISLLLLIVLLIDFNSNWLRSPQGRNHPMLLTNAILSGLIAVILISRKLIKRL